MSGNTEVEFDDEQFEDDDFDNTVPVEQRKLFTKQDDPRIKALYDDWESGDLNLQPEYQRGYVWDKKKASRLIESILMDIPLPIIYLSEDQNDKVNVIDGQQRLYSVFLFKRGKFDDGSDFKLNLPAIDLNGKTFADLDTSQQKKINNYSFRTITFSKNSARDIQFDVFARLNTGATPLKEQEIRNCVFHGPFNNLLKELADDSDFKDLLSIRNEKRMYDVELVLRFIAFYESSPLKYKSPMKNFLNEAMENLRNTSNKKLDEFRDKFKNRVVILKSFLGQNAFKRYVSGNAKNPSGNWEPKKFNNSLFDVLMWYFADKDKNKCFPNFELMREVYIATLTGDDGFIDSIQRSTSSRQAVVTRFDKIRNCFDPILNTTQNQPRCFSRETKVQLFSKNPTCEICGSKIQDIDDAAVDHIEQYWRGGKTVDENARLTHRYCNNARSKHDVVLAPSSK